MVKRSALIKAIEEDFKQRLPGFRKSRRDGLMTLAGMTLEAPPAPSDWRDAPRVEPWLCARGWRLYLPEAWANDAVRRQKAYVPDNDTVKTKPQIALSQIKTACAAGCAPGAVLADAAYGNDGAFRAAGRRSQAPLGEGLPFPIVHDPEAPPIRPERHVENLMATVRRKLIVVLAQTRRRCPCCQAISPKNRNRLDSS